METNDLGAEEREVLLAALRDYAAQDGDEIIRDHLIRLISRARHPGSKAVLLKERPLCPCGENAIHMLNGEPRCDHHHGLQFRQGDATRRIVIKIKGSPSAIDRIEASHWMRSARSLCADWLSISESFDGVPAGAGSLDAWLADLDEAIANIERAKAALRGDHSRGIATSLLRDFQPRGISEPSMTPNAEWDRRARAGRGD